MASVVNSSIVGSFMIASRYGWLRFTGRRGGRFVAGKQIELEKCFQKEGFTTEPSWRLESL